ncbi:hypothetical protein E2C01_034222 [Portunus trituberculatus]|uniref:Uncharacterized protein n=1 Tax=Portunus trituberculatus TaxID=210409 RepID=A0A5B7F567_PORTR|nr:hypothetical protein [Portunus trituberculatus]
MLRQCCVGGSRRGEGEDPRLGHNGRSARGGAGVQMSASCVARTRPPPTQACPPPCRAHQSPHSRRHMRSLTSARSCLLAKQNLALPQNAQAKLNELCLWCSLYRCYVAALVVVVVVGGHLVAAGWSVAHLTRAATCRPPASQRATIGCLNPLLRRSLGERERWSLRSRGLAEAARGRIGSGHAWRVHLPAPGYISSWTLREITTASACSRSGDLRRASRRRPPHTAPRLHHSLGKLLYVFCVLPSDPVSFSATHSRWRPCDVLTTSFVLQTSRPGGRAPSPPHPSQLTSPSASLLALTHRRAAASHPPSSLPGPPPTSRAELPDAARSPRMQLTT